jgi:hypothetical protein
MEGMMRNIFQVAEEFTFGGKIVDIHEHGNGNINDTYLVHLEGERENHFVLQRINTRVFTRPKLIIQNLRTLSEHVENRQVYDSDESFRNWDIPHIRSTCHGEDYHIDSQGSFWRGLSFINHSQSYETVLNEQHAREAGYALGRFQKLVCDLEVTKMYDTLEGFHITPGYLANYDAIMSRNPKPDYSPDVEYCHQVIEAHRPFATVLEDGKDQGKLHTRIIHGDPKINNFMISDQTSQAVSVVDLDTVKPGLIHYDIGDCLRSSCNQLGEETTDFEAVNFDINLAMTILDGYVSVANHFLTDEDYAYMYDCIWLIPFELGLRFFTDYLAGDVYFKVKHVRHNLERALVQFKLTESVESQRYEIQKIVADLRVRTN